MKTNIFSKVAVTMMTVALGAGIVGSISGTVAWFQYSTRSTVSFTGTSAHCTENLQIRVYDSTQGADDNWKADLVADDIANALKKKVSATYKLSGGADGPATNVVAETFIGQVKHGGTYVFKYEKPTSAAGNWVLSHTAVDLATYGISFTGDAANGDQIIVKANLFDTVKPITSGEMKEELVADTLYRNPIYQYDEQSTWAAADLTDYVEIPLELRVKDVNGKASVAQLAKNIYVTKVDMAVKEVAGKGDITSALRLGIEVKGENDAEFKDYGTFSKDGAPVDTYGKLDLNDDGDLDTYGDFAWDKGPEIVYGYQSSNSAITTSVTGGITGATVNKGYFFGKNGVTPGTYTFSYDDTATPIWKLGSNEVKLKDYGISYEGAPANSDKIEVTVVDESTTHPNTAKSLGLDPVDSSSKKGIADDADPYNIIGTPIGQTTGTTNLRVNLKIYLEGWQKLGGSALWDENQFVDAQFNLGVRFSAEAHSDH